MAERGWVFRQMRIYRGYECRRTSYRRSAIALIPCRFGDLLPNLGAPVRVKGAGDRQHKCFHLCIFFQTVNQPSNSPYVLPLAIPQFFHLLLRIHSRKIQEKDKWFHDWYLRRYGIPKENDETKARAGVNSGDRSNCRVEVPRVDTKPHKKAEEGRIKEIRGELCYPGFIQLFEQILPKSGTCHWVVATLEGAQASAYPLLDENRDKCSKNTVDQGKKPESI